MESKKINQLATEMSPAATDLTIVGDPITGVSKKITLEQIASLFAGSVSFYANLAAFPVTGSIDTIYCAKDTNKLYLWSGSAYVQTFPSQALLDTYQLRSEKGASNGYASLDSLGKVPISQLPSSLMEYKGMWSAATNTPTLANGTGDTGDVYICNAAGSVNFGAGAITFAVGDYVIYSGSIWQRSSGAVGTVTSVAITESGDSLNITGSPITTSGTINIGFNGTNLQYVNGAGNLTTFPDLNDYVTLAGTQTITGAKTFSGYTTFTSTVDITSGLTFSNSGFTLVLQPPTLSVNRTVTFADITGTIAMLEGTQTFSGSKTFTGSATFNSSLGNSITLNYGAALTKGNSPSSTSGVLSNIYAAAGNNNLVIADNANTSKLQFQAASSYVYTFPAATGTLALTSDIPILTGYVPYTGATANVDLGTFNLTADVITGATGSFASSGGSDTFAINHSSGAGIALNITKGGNGEGLYINKTSGSGNAATIIGTLNATTLVKSGGTSSQFLKADGTVDSTAYQSALTLTTTGTSGAATLVGATLNIPNYGSALSGYLPLTGGTLTNTASSKLTIAGGTTQNGITFYAAGSADQFYLFSGNYGSNSGFGIFDADANSMRLFINNSGNAILGSDTPTNHKLTVYSATEAAQIRVAGNAPSVVFTDTVTDPATYVSYFGMATATNNFISGSVAGDYIFHSYSGGNILFGISNSLKLKIASTGNVLIGTPTDSGYKLDVNGTGRFSSSVTAKSYTLNGTNGNSGQIIQQGDLLGSAATNLLFQSSTGNSIGFLTNGGTTFNMFINTSGNVGIGTSSPISPANSYRYLHIEGGNSTSGGVLYLSTSGAGNSSQIYADTSGLNINTNTSLPIIFNPAGTERMRITSGGNVGIGTSSPLQTATNRTVLTVNGISSSVINLGVSNAVSGYIYSDATTSGFYSSATLYLDAAGANAMIFNTNGSERMRIRNDGIVMIGTTTYNSALKGVLINPDGNAWFTVNNNTTSSAPIELNRLNGDGRLLNFMKDTVNVGYISTNTYSLPSDLNFKKNINTLELGLNLVTKLRAVSYNHKIDDDDAALSTGFIAQELEQSLIELGVNKNEYYILQHKPNKDETQSQYWLDYTKMIPILANAIKEQQAQIEELKQLIAAK
jgi:hypothetical protein